MHPSISTSTRAEPKKVKVLEPTGVKLSVSTRGKRKFVTTIAGLGSYGAHAFRLFCQICLNHVAYSY